MKDFLEVWIWKENVSETKYGFAKKKMMKVSHKVWIFKKMMALRKSMDLQENMMGVHFVMKDSHEVWIWKKNSFEMKYRFGEKKLMGIHNVMKDYQEV